jgi:hypothetical protein
MTVCSIRTTLLLKRNLFLLFISASIVFPAQARIRKIVCKRGKIRVTIVDNVKKYSCVIKKRKVTKTADGKTPFFNGPFRYQASWWARLAARTTGSPTLSSNRYRGYLEGEQDILTTSRLIFGGRVTHDLMSNIQSDEEYRDDFSQNGKPEAEIWNFFGEYKNNGWRVRVGQQQVAWGETFGFFYADLVNPKDLRERSLGRLSELRLPVPMINTQWSTENLSVQLLYLPFFSPDRLPTAKSDFFPDLNIPVEVDTTSSYKLDDPKGDVGGRISGTIKGMDLSLLHFDYMDRQPFYKIKTDVVDKLMLERHHRRIKSTGLTFSTELAGWIVRSENVYTPSRSFNTVGAAGIAESHSIQRVHVIGLDAPKMGKLSFGIQFSNDRLIGGEETLLRPREINLTSLRLAHDLPNESTIELLATNALNDGSSLIQATYLKPVSDIHELEFYVNQFGGSSASFFGQTKDASRVYIGIRGAFNG